MTQLSSTGLLWAYGSIGLGLIVLILVLRHYFQKEPKKDNSQAFLKKYPGADIFRFSSTFFRLGLAIALVLTIMAFNWTLYDSNQLQAGPMIEDMEDVMVAPPPTAHKPPPPPPPPPPEIKTVEDEEIIEEKIFESTLITEETVIEPPEIIKDVPPPPPPPKPIEIEEEDDLFRVVEEMPRFGKKCASKNTKVERKQCSDQEIYRFLSKNLRYPQLAIDNGFEGKVIVRFVIEPDGQVSGIEVLREPGGGLGAEAARVIALMNDAKYGWTAGKQRGKAVRVQYNLPVVFNLN